MNEIERQAFYHTEKALKSFSAGRGAAYDSILDPLVGREGDNLPIFTNFLASRFVLLAPNPGDRRQ